MSGSPKSNSISMLQIKADLSLAKAAMEEAKTAKPAKYAKYLKGQAVYHLQQASEKLIKSKKLLPPPCAEERAFSFLI